MSAEAARVSRRRVDGLVLLDKPAGVTSNAALQRVKRAFRALKAGHAGTLDPLATGLLPICLGEGTKFSALLLDADKSYLATVRLGVTTTTGDAQGEVLETAPVAAGTAQLEAVLAFFVGRHEQLPPMYSALKHRGRPLYEYARRGEEVERAPRPVEIFEIALEWHEGERFAMRVRCGKGTYIRTLAEDIGRRLGCGASIEALRRTRVGRLDVAEAWTLERIESADDSGRAACLRPLDEMVGGLPRLVLPPELAARILHGVPVSPPAQGAPGLVALYRDPGELLGIGLRDDAGMVAPQRLLAAGQAAA